MSNFKDYSPELLRNQNLRGHEVLRPEGLQVQEEAATEAQQPEHHLQPQIKLESIMDCY